MIFALAKEEPALFVLLAEADLPVLRSGRTLEVRREQLRAAHFDRVILSLHSSNEAILALIAKTGSDVSHVVTPTQQPGEGTCAGCRGVMSAGLLLGGRCIVCWREMAERLSPGGSFAVPDGDKP